MLLEVVIIAFISQDKYYIKQKTEDLGKDHLQIFAIYGH